MDVYLDNATTTGVDGRVLDSMREFFVEQYGAPTTEYGHSWGTAALEALEDSRNTIANALGVSAEEVVFTSGGVESNNMAIQGVARSAGEGKIITSQIEHSSILETVRYLEGVGFEVEALPVDRTGFIQPETLAEALDDDSILVALGHSNGEIGTVQDVEKISRICRDRGVPLHLDARYSFMWEPLDLGALDVTTASVTSHLIHGPKGIGALIESGDIEMEPLIHGPGGEFGTVPGTPNVPGAVGMARAIEIWREEDVDRVRGLRDTLWSRIHEEFGDTELNGPTENRLPGNLNVNFSGVEGESILLYLDMAGIAVSTGSACSSKNLKPSYVLSAIGRPPERSHGSIRFSLSRFNDREQIDYACDKLVEVVSKLQEMSSMR